MELFFHHKASPFVRKPLLAIAEFAIPIDERVIDMTASTAMDEYVSINPNRRFPALRDGGLVLWESNAILRYLAAKHGPGWLGRTAEAAAWVDQWLFWELGHLGPALLPLQNLRLGFTPRPDREEAALLADAVRSLSVLEGQLAAHPYVAGSDITIADLAIAALFSFANEANLLPAGHPHVQRWLEALRSRPSWQSTERMKREALEAYGVKLPERSR